MELKERFSVLIQGIELAQKNGVFTLDDAVLVKKAIDNIKEFKELKDSIHIIAQAVSVAQKQGVYTLSDAHLIFLALDGIDKEIEDNESVEVSIDNSDIVQVVEEKNELETEK